MTLAFPAFLLVINLSPTALFSTKIGPQVDGGAEVLVAGMAKFDLVHLSRLKTDRRRARVTLQGLVILKPFAIVAALTQKPRGQFITDARQGSEKIMVGMLPEKFLDTLTVHFELLLQHV